MEAFVTGATGFLGRNLIDELLSKRWQVRALARNRARAGLLPREVSIVRGNVSDEGALLDGALGVDVVYHLAGATSGNWDTHRAATVEGTRRMLRVCHDAGVRRFVLASSIVVYDKSGPSRDAVLDEASLLLAASPAAGAYARGKVEAENLAKQYLRGTDGRMQVVIVRPGLIYGKGRLTFPHLGELVGQTRVACGPSSLLLPLVEVGSCVDALVRLATAPDAAGKIYNIVDANQSTRRDYLAALKSPTAQSQRVIYLPAWPVATAVGAIAACRKWTGDPDPDVSAAKIRERAVEMRYDTSALQRDTGWAPLRELEEGMSRAGLAARRGIPRDIERAGVIGAGMIARVHLAALRQTPGVRVAGVFDSNPAAAEALAAEAGVPAFADQERFYEEAQPQLVHVLTPPHAHAAVARDALQHGAHVLLEKPATTSLEDCDALVAAADAGGLTIGVDETIAWDPIVRRARAALIHGVLGELVHVDVFMSYELGRGGRLEQILRGTGAWEHQLVGGPLEDLLPHPLSVVRALCGELDLLHSQSKMTGRVPCDFPDELRLTLGSGAVTAEVGISLSARPDDFLLTIHGTRASLRVDVQNMLFDCLTPLPGPRAAARGLRVLRSATRMLYQTARNGLLIASRQSLPPASPIHLIREHYAALMRGEPPPAPLHLARPDIVIARSVWPMPQGVTRDSPIQQKYAKVSAALSGALEVQ